MNISKLYLHIGLPKTGTSALEQFFYENRERLLEKGLFYPRTGLDGWAQHHFPASINGLNFKTESSLSELLEGITAEPEFNPRYAVLLSSEAFHNLRQGHDMDKLRQALEGVDVKIIVYLRRQDYWIQSAYNQSVKSHRHRSTASIEQFVEKRQFNRILDYPRFLKKWEQSFGSSNIIVKVYEKEQMPQGVFHDFMDVFSITLDDTFRIPAGNINPSLSPFAVKLLRLLNHIPMSPTTHNGVVKLFSTIPLGFVSKNYFSEHSLMSLTVRQQLLKRYEESNRIIAKRYLKRRDGVLFYERIH